MTDTRTIRIYAEAELVTVAVDRAVGELEGMVQEHFREWAEEAAR